jgi:ABC-2 type transport system ATP-binding protein
MIQVENLTKYFGSILAVDHISFQIERGEVVGFLGPNGAGKTTTLRILTSYLPATSGIATVAGHDVMTDSMEVRKNIGYLPESVPLYSEMRVEEYLDYRSKLKGVDRKERPKRLEYCLDRCRIREVRRRLIGTLSKGYRQRVGLADAMVHDPPILILDEPTVGLDPVQIRETLALIRELGEKRTIMLSTHILSEIEAICRRVIIITWGRIGSDKRMGELEAADAIVLETSGPSEQVMSALQGIDGVALVTPVELGHGRSGFEIHTHHHKDLRDAIGQRMAKSNWAVRQLSLKHRKLEDHFFDVMRAADPLRRERADERLKPAPSAGARRYLPHDEG